MFLTENWFFNSWFFHKINMHIYALEKMNNIKRIQYFLYTKNYDISLIVSQIEL